MRFVLILMLCIGGFWIGSNALKRVHHRYEGEVTDFTPGRREYNFIRRCLHGPQTQTGSRRLLCNELQSVVRQMEGDSTRRRPRNVDSYKSNYISRIIDMRSHKVGSRDAMLDMVAPCSKFSPSLNNKWRSFLRGRTQRPEATGFTHDPASQRIDGNVLEVTFNRPTNATMERFRFHEFTFADLVLHRASPCDIDEELGIYSLSVIKSSNQSEEFDAIVHRSQQSSCPTTGGNLMVASLNMNAIQGWLYDENQVLKLQVILVPHSQTFIDNRNPSTPENVLRRALFIHFSFTETPLVRPLGPRPIDHFVRPRDRDRGQTSRRNRRGLFSRPDNRGCRKVSYTVNFRSDWTRDVKYPVEYDLGECVGRCEFPLSENMNATNHAITMKLEEVNNPSPPIAPSVNCVPITYDNFYFWELDSTGTLFLTFLKDMKVGYCGCA